MMNHQGHSRDNGNPAALLRYAAVVAVIVFGLSWVMHDADAEGAPGWLDEVQTYCMAPVLPEKAKELHASVNGVWGGIGGVHPIVTHADTVPAVQATFGMDGRAFVAACREAGLRVVGIVNGLEGFAPMLDKWPQLEGMACRDAEGKPARTGDMLLMCANNPDWLEWEIEFGKQGIDLGADMVMVDTPMSSSFISGFLGGGFCPYCMNNFENHLEDKFSAEELERRFGLSEFDAEAVVARLHPFQDVGREGNQPFLKDTPDARLFQEFIRCQEQASFDTRKRLIQALRDYARERGREVAFATNAADLGSVNPWGHWIRALMFADLFDVFAYEQNHVPTGGMTPEVMRLPRGKWAAYHKLACAAMGRRNPAVLHAFSMGAIMTQAATIDLTTNTWMGVQSAEAYASNGAYVMFYVEPEIGNDFLLDSCWKTAADHADFVQNHTRLYDEPLESGSSLAVLFLYNERGRTIPGVFPSYLGIAQALVEGNIPFDVLFGGDGRYVEDRLTTEAIKHYRTIIVPSPIDPTENQKRLVRDFVKQGGVLVCQEPDRLGIHHAVDDVPFEQQVPYLAGEFMFGSGTVYVLSGHVTPTGTNDIGSNYFTTNNPDFRRQIVEFAHRLGFASILERDADGLVCAFPVVQEDRRRVVVHLVNYDVDYANDAIRRKEDMGVRIERPAFLSGKLTVRLYGQGDGSPVLLETTSTDDAISFTVPTLDIFASVELSVSGDEAAAE